MPEPKTEGKCRCGRCRCWYGRWIDSLHQDEIEGPRHCPDCGYFLDDDGWAYEMVRKDSVLMLIDNRIAELCQEAPSIEARQRLSAGEDTYAAEKLEALHIRNLIAADAAEESETNA